MTLRYSHSVYRRAIVMALKKIGPDNLSLIAAGVGFFAMLSIFPALAALIALLSIIADPEVVVLQLEEMRELMPEDVYDILHTQVVGLVSTSSGTLGWAGLVSVLFALWSARAGVGAMIHGMNVVYDSEGRGTLGHYLRALLITVALIAVGIIALLAVVIAPLLLAFLSLGGLTSVVIEIVRWIVAIVVIFVGIWLLHRFGPNHSQKLIGFFTPGLVFSVAAWAAVTIGFSFYVAHFGNYNEVYGSIGAVIAMLVWLWISSFLVLIGGALNAEIVAAAS
ncbi:MAG: YihY/virulence factor BrkB family protein, partial [Pseudomonadota bacterium]